MQITGGVAALAALLVVGLAAGTALANPYARAAPGDESPLDKYVNKPDSHYTWAQVPNSTFHGPGYTGYVLNMTSQQWLSEKEVSQSIWWHYIAVVVPDELNYHKRAFMYITGGSNTGSVPDGGGEDILLCAAVAVTTGSACSVLFQVPNEPIYFKAEQPPKRRTEDAIIAYTWNHFLDHPDESEWLLRLPMTKAAVRCMDTTTAFLQKLRGMNVTEYVVAGASKRGWTTWTTAAVDKRVIGAIPIVMDMLNMVPNIHHFWQAYGGWSFALKDYYNMNFTARLDDPNFPKMTAIIDPLSYADRLTMPKLVIDSTGDEFFMNDDNWFWWGKLKGETHLLMVHNAEHSLATNLVEVIEGISSFAHDVLADKPRPSMTWTMSNSSTGGSIKLTTSEKPSRVTVRWADTLNHTRRDWRLIIGGENCPYIKVSGECIQPVLWQKEAATKIDDTHYEVHFDNPPAGWRAFLLDVQFRAEVGVVPHVFTSQVNIIPDVYPFPPCHGEGCRGQLL
ncbi:AprA [Salpingoeca rosetta]|uniref:AprA n=1 Tax=Salpingoeca rosetta (strain ATCC 50818 / BSB-021) TaxID=946362 RepID=F2UBF2_SALR5|nr:AprA [Salpingoeca rosetta]EGD73818.1 AprA [Salpingoeca rosetta]|eukprot:XP_004993381.1 AprA [Salpingoeca rosetta]